MDHTRDNPLKRFNAFWVAILLVTTFGIGCIILRPFTLGNDNAAYEAASEGRLAIKNEVLKAEAETLNVESLNDQMASLAKTLHSGEPTQGAMPVVIPAPAPAEAAPAEAAPTEDAPTEETPTETNPESSN